MKKVLFTGGTGFLGRNLLPVLRGIYDIYAPTRNELDLKQPENIVALLKKRSFDVIIHAAIPNLLSSESDKKESLIGNSLLPFMTMHQYQEYFGKLIYFGSGAEYDKTSPIKMAKEEDIGISIPSSEYGLAKFTMNSLARNSKNIYNLRIFGCYGRSDAYFKLITYAIQCCLKKESIIINQDCIFDYMQVLDLIPVIDYCINTPLEYHDYNVCTSIGMHISDICRYIINELDRDLEIIVKQDGLDNEYTGSNSRLLRELPDLIFTDIKQGIKMQIKYETEKR